MRTAMVAQADMMRVFKVAGVFDALPFIVSQQQEKSDIERLADLTKAAIGMADVEGADEAMYEESLQEYLRERDKNADEEEDESGDVYEIF